MFYGRKGPEFWKSIEAALTEIYPEHGAQDCRAWKCQSTGAEVHERPRVLVVDDDPDIEKFLASRLSKFGVDTLYASDAMHGYRIARKEQARPSSSPIITCRTETPNTCCTGCATPRRPRISRSSSSAGGRLSEVTEADPAAGNRRAAGRRAIVQEIVRHRGAIQRTEEILRLREASPESDERSYQGRLPLTRRQAKQMPTPPPAVQKAAG